MDAFTIGELLGVVIFFVVVVYFGRKIRIGGRKRSK